MPAIGVPSGVPHVVISIAAREVEIIAEEAAGDPDSTWVVQQGTEAGIAIDELCQGRASLAVVRPPA